MCNCNQSQPCNSCSSGIPCNCPPQYPIVQFPVPCTCCPNGYTYGITPNYPNGICTDLSGRTTAPTPCVPCESDISTDCVTYQCTAVKATDCSPCSNVAPGDNMTTIINKICPTNPANILAMLQVIALDTTFGLKQAFCQIVNYCSFIPGSTISYIGPISFTIP